MRAIVSGGTILSSDIFCERSKCIGNAFAKYGGITFTIYDVRRRQTESAHVRGTMTHWHHPASEPFGQKLRFCPICLTAVGSFVRFGKLARIARGSRAGAASAYSSSPAQDLAPLS